MDPRFMLDVALKAAQWERAKGELRALVALQGSYQNDASLKHRWLGLDVRVRAFIAEIEGEGLHE